MQIQVKCETVLTYVELLSFLFAAKKPKEAGGWSDGICRSQERSDIPVSVCGSMTETVHVLIEG